MAELIINTGAVLNNYRHYAAGGQVIPVLKSNGYGLGAQQLRCLLHREGATLFACATPEEALRLAEPESDLLLLSCIHDMTLLRALLGQIEYKGTVRHLTSDGRPAADLRTGYVPQQLEFDRSSPVTVMDFMAGSLSRRPVFLGVSKKTRERVLAALERTHCAQLADRALGALSGGELQRVLLALALTPQPDLLILDEPVSGVDQNGLETFYQTVDELKRRNHMAILLVSHDLSVVERYADRVVLMQGTVIKQGSPEVVFDSPEFEQVFYTRGGRA